MDITDKIIVRYAEKSDKAFWLSLDKHISEEAFCKKVDDGQAYVLLVDGDAAGILRYNLFWDNTPFCTMLYIKEQYQRRGYGRALMRFWENEMKNSGYNLLLVSTQSDESAQHFYRALCYKDCGCLLAPGQAAELFLSKCIN